MSDAPDGLINQAAVRPPEKVKKAAKKSTADQPAAGDTAPVADKAS